MSEKPVEYAVVNNEYMLPVEEAIALLRILAKAERVCNNYRAAVPFRLADSGTYVNTLTLLTTAQHAAIFLEEPK